MARYARLPSLSLLRSFEAAGRYESFTMAAEELGVTQGAISRQVRELESVLGLRLFRRVGRAVRLTDAGRGFYETVTRDLDSLQTSVARAVSGGEGASVLSIAVLPTFAARWLIPRLPDFKAQYPDVELELRSHTKPFDLTAHRMDLAIHFGRGDWPGTRLVPLCPEDLVVVCSRDLSERAGSASAIFALPLLHLSSRPGLWARYRMQKGLPALGALPGPRLDQFSMVIAGALAGLGAAILPTYLIEEELASEALVCVGRLDPADDEGYFLATPLGQDNNLATAFSKWIRRQVPR
ncbi:LysR substrate-binding domain-containing protein [Palleronia caenipelagi]|uniref:LysR family transcriptional regulator n=1 Tax=Palleronia caenipelagi TaxID=2489174 RepID=A0A547PM48_9RHOB|nr:LysR substrate-binding domain-containing protein [Palleronia caenipelagi]TRD15207.1 LysR family transcriptional regulator [Palleronia caenipelagi]